MTPGFMTTWPDRMGAGPTHFVEKIWAGIKEGLDRSEILFYSDNGKRFDPYSWHNPKRHTFREDPHDRWKVGMKIHPVINNRTPQRFQFAPILECKGTQKIWIEHAGDAIVVDIEGRQFLYWGTDDYSPKLDQISGNDGFDSVEHFFQWFDKDFEGKIIHWTDLKY